MSEGSDYDPGPWRGVDFKDARKDFDQHAGRSYAKAVKEEKKALDFVFDRLKSDALAVLAILCDVTGSMGEKPRKLFGHMPYMDNERKEYFGEDSEISVAGVGDIHGDKYPFQGRLFTKGVAELKEKFTELVVEGGGGGQLRESYELAALYYCRNVDIPKAKKAVLIIIADEMPYDSVSRYEAMTYAKVSLEKDITVEEIFAELKRKYDVYVIQSPYEDQVNSDITKRVKAVWERLVGSDHLAFLEDPERILDVIFGILADATAKVDYFIEEINERQRPEQVVAAFKALKTIHHDQFLIASVASGKSVTFSSKSNIGKKAKPLI
jgi:hypothetical protein